MPGKPISRESPKRRLLERVVFARNFGIIAAGVFGSALVYYARERLVARPSDSFSSNTFFHVGVSPSDGAGVLGMSADVFYELAAKVRNRSEYAASNYVALDLGKPDFDLISHDE